MGCNMILTPTELARLHSEGSVRIVRKCEPQPLAEIDGILWGDAESPFPPAGTREVIDGVECVWGESGFDQVEARVPGTLDDTEGFISVFTTTVRKDEG